MIRKPIILVVLLSTLLVATLPQEVVFAEDVVRLTIINYSDRDIWLKLEGPKSVYNLHVPPGETRAYTPLRGEYYYIYYACGTWVKGILDLSSQKIFEVPNCGFELETHPDHPRYLDGGEILKLVNVTFENETGAYALAILNGPSVFVFSFNDGQEREFTIPKGDYSMTVYGCGGHYNTAFFANFFNVKKLVCP